MNKLKEIRDNKTKGKHNSHYDTSILKFMVGKNKELRLDVEI